jgi:uncharacterized protein (TIGR03437 family)
MTITRTTYSLLYFTLTAILPTSGFSQVNQGPFNFRHLQFVTDDSGHIVDSRALFGIMDVSQPGFFSLPGYYGSGTLTFSGVQAIGARAPAPFSASGLYSSSTLPTVATLTNPQDPTLSINTRYGGYGVLGSSTESSHGTVDLFVAIPAFNDFRLERFTGVYFLTYIEEFDGDVRSFFARVQSDGAGSVTLLSAQSHAGSSAPEATMSGHGSYTVNPDGTGTISLPPIGSFPAATYSIQLGAFYFAIGGKQTGAQDLLVLEPASLYPDSALGSLGSTGLGNQYSTLGLRIDASGATDPSAYVGTVNAFPGLGELVESRHTHSSEANYDFTGARAITIDKNGSAFSELNQIGLGLGTWIGSEQSSVDASGHEINIAFQTGQTVIGSDLFLYPLAIVNGASFAPPILPVSPGEFLMLYLWGTEAPGLEATEDSPYTTSLLGFSVTANGRLVPITSIRQGAINVILPLDISGSEVTLQVRNGAAISNSVTLPFAKTAPGVFTQTGNGLGNAAALHADYTPITVDHPAHEEEVILLYLTGLGSVMPPIVDGAVPGSSPTSLVTTPVKVLIADMPAEVQFAGLAPGFLGLYQLNVRVPRGIVAGTSAEVEIQTPEATTRQATLPIR